MGAVPVRAASTTPRSLFYKHFARMISFEISKQPQGAGAIIGPVVKWHRKARTASLCPRAQGEEWQGWVWARGSGCSVKGRLWRPGHAGPAAPPGGAAGDGGVPRGTTGPPPPTPPASASQGPHLISSAGLWYFHSTGSESGSSRSSWQDRAKSTFTRG